ncbi:GNAT family N-acyltransferase [Oceanospirillum linum]|uniref:GNAT family N-acyltransferase n=1 Tax=Oceanospirillum linum TaxID=966 RepID=UPI00089E7933|nr:lysophospholipid acyltransferase family protein [Oceanospirillum linum]SEF79501.1 Putative hemolysin [Oleiphilus messinensis]SMP18511.1 Putative hemolysin [Oceanospirillum linum]
MVNSEHTAGIETSTDAEKAVNIERIVSEKFPALARRNPLIKNGLFRFLRWLSREHEINRFMQQHQDASAPAFVDHVLDYFDFSLSINENERENIPTEGRVVIVANHPIGTLDGLALLKLVRSVRPDVRIVANDILMQFAPLQPLLLPVDNMSQTGYKESTVRIVNALKNDEAVIIFPAGEVSRAGPAGIKDGRWQSGFLHFARKTNSPILPIHLGGRNSSLFYSLSSLAKPIGTLMLMREMFKQHKVTLPVRIGQLIPLSQMDINALSNRDKIKLLKKHVYRLAKNRKPFFQTEKSIAHPEDRRILRRELKQSQLLGETKDGKQIYLFDSFRDSVVMKELGRLREISFRKVGEGSGEKRDLDKYDHYYRHLILWDEDELEIVGAYRIAEANRIIENEGIEALYCSTLFSLSTELTPKLKQGIELGRSFVQPKYWGKRSLDYLWFGIGAYLRHHPEVGYMFGPVSLSNSYPQAAKDLIVYYYNHYYGAEHNLAHANAPYLLNAAEKKHISALFTGNNAQEDFQVLREQLDHLGVTVPTLYKQYTELCEPGGIEFLDFSVDADFGYCIDGLIMVNIEQVKERKRERYINTGLNKKIVPEAADH